MTSREFQERLGRRVRRAGVSVAPSVTDQLEMYYRLLERWNRKINLTGFELQDVPTEALDRLIVEPLVAARYVPSTARDMLDVGSGGGSPAIPLALTCPSLRVLMVESKTRKAVFLSEVIRELDLGRASVATARFEELLTRPDLHEKHDLLTLRAVRIEPRTLMSLQAFLRPEGLILLFKRAGADASAVVPPLRWRATYPLVDDLGSCIVLIDKRPVGSRHGTRST